MINRFMQLYRCHALIQILVFRDLKVRYRRTTLGFLWSFLNPLVLMLTYMLVFSIYFRIKMDNYSVYLLCGILPWMCFSGGLIEATHSIIANGGLIKRVSLPSEIFPLINIIANAIHYLLSIPILFLFLAYSGVEISWPLVAFPVVLSIQLIFSYGLALIMSSLVVQFRDLLHIVPNLLMIWMFITPIIYPVAMVPEKFRPMLSFNPMVTMIGSYQDIFFYNRFPSWTGLAILAALSCCLLLVGMLFFEARKYVFAEEV